MRELIENYYAAFNRGDVAAMAALVSEDVEHHVNQGEIRRSKAAFEAFNAHMGITYKEQLHDIVIMISEDGARAAAEFVVHGEYLESEAGLPQAKGQKYELPAGTFFEIKNGQISRITTYYNLADWISQVS